MTRGVLRSPVQTHLVEDGTRRKGLKGLRGSLDDGTDDVEDDRQHEHLCTSEHVGNFGGRRLRSSGDDGSQDGDGG